MNLNWADRRRFWLLGTAAVVFLLLVVGVGIAVMYETPSCMDKKLNQDETGVDCGGSCAYLCSADAEAPRVNFVRGIQNKQGRVDVIAFIENRNESAEAVRAGYTIEVRGEDNLVLAERTGTIDLPARTISPVFIPSIYQGTGVATRTFLTFMEPVKFSRAKERVAPSVQNITLVPGDRPRLTATLKNSSAETIYNQKVVATIFSTSDNTAVGASQTVVREIPAQGTSEVVFTWNEPFGVEVMARVLPVLELR
ncbi:MAG: hypothetical protein AB199_04255 [Parcubacteria bacterium C7867-004]|nr:MAG: hypothetical protein AB199_04255 [Parcubacteria bacterium C7867-004]